MIQNMMLSGGGGSDWNVIDKGAHANGATSIEFQVPYEPQEFIAYSSDENVESTSATYILVVASVGGSTREVTFSGARSTSGQSTIQSGASGTITYTDSHLTINRSSGAFKGHYTLVYR